MRAVLSIAKVQEREVTLCAFKQALSSTATIIARPVKIPGTTIDGWRAQYLNDTTMKRVGFSSVTQSVLFVAAVLFACLTLVGMFFNPIHIATFAMSLVLAIAIYKEKDW